MDGFHYNADGTWYLGGTQRTSTDEMIESATQISVARVTDSGSVIKSHHTSIVTPHLQTNLVVYARPSSDA